MPAEPATCKVGRGPPLGRPTSQVAGAAGARAGGGARFFRGLVFWPISLINREGAERLFFSARCYCFDDIFLKFTSPYHLANRSHEFVQNLVGFCDFPWGPHASRWMPNLLGFRVNCPMVLMTRFSNSTLPCHLESRSYESVQNLTGFHDVL